MRKTAFAMSVLLVAAGCAVTRQGTLMRVPGGDGIAVVVTVENDSALVTGVFPGTGEKFRGRLRAQPAQRRPEIDPIPYGSPLGGAAGGPGAPPSPHTTGRTLDLSGKLIGEEGTELECVVQVERRIRLRGGGTCQQVGSDDDVLYRLVF